MQQKSNYISTVIQTTLICFLTFMVVPAVATADGPDANPDSATVSTESKDTKTPLNSVAVRYKNPSDSEQPDFQRHVSPLLGRLGCNGRACHGSFQGQGGFQLSLFGYDFEADHKALLAEGRVEVADVKESLVLTKPTDEDIHEGGQRYEVGSWQFNLIKRWIDEGAKTENKTQKLTSLVVEPSNLNLVNPEKQVQLKATAHWDDGTVEDVTPLCRFSSNNDVIAKISEEGAVSTDTVPGDTHVVVYYDKAVVPVPVVHPIEQKLGSIKELKAPTPIDKLAAQKWNQLGLQPSELADDTMFLRRVSIDITGTLPTPDEIRDFIADENPNKRRKKIDELLESPAYAAWWTTFFCDMTENNTYQLRNIAYNNNIISDLWYDWIYQRVEDNVPYDEMIAGIVTGSSQKEGETYTEYCARMTKYVNGDSFGSADSMPFYWMRREFRDRDARAISFAHAFLGLRIQCAQCHKHPFDRWTQDDFQEFAKFFGGVSLGSYSGGGSKEEKQEYVAMLEKLDIDPKDKNRGDIRKKLTQALRDGKTVPFGKVNIHQPKPSREELAEYKKLVQAAKKKDRKAKVPKFQGVTSARLLGAETVNLKEHEDIRQPVMDWMRRADNPYFARALVNRVWARYFGAGIVDPADDLNMANPPSNKPLLDHLANEFVKKGYDLKWLHREIANSRTYQLSWVPNETNKDDRRNFSRALPRRLPAEVLFDAVASAASNSSTNRGYRDAVDNRAISIPGTVTNGYGKKKGGADSAFALQVFGRSERSSSCDCDRTEETSLMQTVYLQNDRDIHLMLQQKGSWINLMAEKYNASGVSSKEKSFLLQSNRKLLSYKKQKANYEKLISRVDGDDNKAASKRKGYQKQIAKVDKGIESLKRKIEPIQDKIDAARIEKEKMDLGEVVTEAYLRTLSRFPSDSEKERCLAHIKEEKDLIKGVTGVMWALVNTKEFIVNH